MYEAIAKYFVALATQMGLLTAMFTGLDFFVAKSSISRVPFAINWVFFYFLALKSRVFNPLSNRRPQPVTKEIEGAEQRKMPSFQYQFFSHLFAGLKASEGHVPVADIAVSLFVLR